MLFPCLCVWGGHFAESQLPNIPTQDRHTPASKKPLQGTPPSKDPSKQSTLRVDFQVGSGWVERDSWSFVTLPDSWVLPGAGMRRKPSLCGQNLIPLPRQSSGDSRRGEAMEAGTRYPSTGRSTQLTEGERAGAQRAEAARPKRKPQSERPAVPEASIPARTYTGRARTADPTAPASSSSSSSSLDKMAAAGSAGSLARPARPRPRSRSLPPPAPRRTATAATAPVRSPQAHPAAATPTARAAPAGREQHQAPGPRKCGLPTPAPRRWRRWWRTGPITQCRLRGPCRGAPAARLAAAKDTGPHLRR